MYDSNSEIAPFGLNPLVGLDLGNMTRDQIGEVLSGVENISWKGGSPDGQFMQWKYTDTGNIAVRIDSPDAVTKYDHVHLYDNNGSSLDINGNKVDSKSPEVHIKIKCT